MKIDDLLTFAGDHRLSSFTWGTRIVDVVNFHGDGIHRISLEQTGLEAKRILRSMEASVLVKMFTLDYDIETGKVTEDNLDDDEPTNYPVPDDTPPPEAPVTPPKADTGLFAGEPLKNKVILIIAAILTFLAITLVTIVSIVSIQTGQMQESETSVGLVNALAEIIKALFGGN